VASENINNLAIDLQLDFFLVSVSSADLSDGSTDCPPFSD